MRRGLTFRTTLAAVVALALAYAALAAAACGPPAAASLAGHNVVLINIDTLRADHLGAYGYGRETSPFLDRLAGEGVVFERALSNSSFTRESVATLFTGRLPTSGGGIGWHATPSAGAATIAELLRDAGYRTGFFSNTTMLKDPSFTRGFDVFEHLSPGWALSRMGAKLTARAAEFLAEGGDRPFFLYLHYLDPHGPYDPFPEDRARFDPGQGAPSLELYKEVRPRCHELIAEGFGPGEARFEDLVARYDAEILDTDRAIGRLFEALERHGHGDNTLVVVTADHGEEFLEHDFVEHAWTLYQESLHVPLLVWAPGALEPARVPALVSGVDVVPTLATLLALPEPQHALDGRPLFEREGGAWRPVPDDEVFIGEMMIRERSLLRTVIKGEWKYIAAYRWLPAEARPRAAKLEHRLRRQLAGTPPIVWGEVVREELYRLSDDPGETRNLAETRLDELDELRAELAAYRARCEESGLGLPAREGEPEDLSPEMQERLRSLGYM